MQTAGARAAETAQWWEEALEGALGWVTTAVTTVEVAVPSPRAQILRLAAIVDAAALTFMAEKVRREALEDDSGFVRSADAAPYSHPPASHAQSVSAHLMSKNEP